MGPTPTSAIGSGSRKGSPPNDATALSSSNNTSSFNNTNGSTTNDAYDSTGSTTNGSSNTANNAANAANGTFSFTANGFATTPGQGPHGSAVGVGGGNAYGQRIPCVNCGTLETPLWRRTPEGNPICNACGGCLHSIFVFVFERVSFPFFARGWLRCRACLASRKQACVFIASQRWLRRRVTMTRTRTHNLLWPECGETLSSAAACGVWLWHAAKAPQIILFIDFPFDFPFVSSLRFFVDVRSYRRVDSGICVHVDGCIFSWDVASIDILSLRR
ncbi:hypothetical protein C8R43DRAFT_889700 [Mycena crocata]|nr:hypothetical protein C8R43DRAFT_889700 [Mycena crocata]